MKILPGATLLPRTLLVAALLTGASVPLLAHSDTNDFGGLELPLVESPPQGVGSFWRLSSYFMDTNGFIRFSRPPTPSIPLVADGLPVYYLTPDTNFGIFSTNSYVIDDTSIITEQGAWQATSQEESEGSGDSGDFGPLYSYPSNYLYLIIDAVSNSTVYIRAMSTVPDQVYELLSRETLLDTNGIAVTNWTSEGTFLGAEDQDWTPTTLAVGTRTNSLFIWCRSWVDSDGDGLPDWWEMQYGLDPESPDTGNTGVPDGYKNPAGDGWSNIYKYEHGMNPSQFYTPPPPRNVQARLDSTGTNAILTWESGGGPVTNYGIIAIYSSSSAEIGQVSANTFTFTDHVSSDFMSVPGTLEYMIRAFFSNGSHADSALATFTKSELSIEAQIVRGPNGSPYLTISPTPPNLAYLRVYIEVWPVVQWVDVHATNLQNGLVAAPITDKWIYQDAYAVQAFGTNGDFGQTIWAYTPFIENLGPPPVTNFVNAAVHLKENLKFLLRSATLTQPFSYVSGLSVRPDLTEGAPDWSELPKPELWYARPATDPSYEYYGFHSFSSNLNYSFLEELRPVQENQLWRNFVYDPAEIGPFGLTNGMDLWTVFPMLRAVDYPMLHWFDGDSTGPFPLAVNTVNSTNLVSGYLRFGIDSSDFDEAIEQGFAVTPLDGLPVYLPSGTRNLYGLAINSILIPQSQPSPPDIFYAGGSPADSGGVSYMNATLPDLRIVDYYFASQTPYFKFYTNLWWYDASQPAPPLPGSPSFSATNTSPLLITGVGQPFTISGWAKMAISNGYSGKYAYLEQYWDKAYTTDTNGLATTNQTGLLSPYGEFFPTEPGPAALVTMPNIDSGQRGTGIVHVIKLQLDVNHDGTMDLSFGGPDNTSQDRPFVFWLNNDCDRGFAWADGHVDPDDDVTRNARGNFYDYEKVPDSEYRDLAYYGATLSRLIPSLRDLEDFARLWVCGVTTNLLPSLPAGTVVALSWGDKGNPNTKNPTIDLFRMADTNGFIAPYGSYAYLTNVTSAQLQTNAALYLARLGPGDSIEGSVTDFLGLQRLIWCGVKAGVGKLTLTFRHGTNTIAETSAYIELKDIKDMYERWSVGDNPSVPPITAAYHPSDGLPTNSPPFKYTSTTDTNTPYILVVHDYDLPSWKKDAYAETAFKRLYWQGYEGRFGLFRWPCATNVLNDSEFNAWRSARGLLNLLTNLDGQYPGKVYLMAHGYGAIAVGEALRLAGTNIVVNTYIAMQGAVASRAYSAFAPFRTVDPTLDSGTPDRYLNYYTSNAPPYFAGVGGAVAYINYFNTNDFVLTNKWRLNQDLKPDISRFYRLYHWDGTNFYVNYFPALLLVFPADTYEIFSYCDEAGSEAIGAQPFLGAPFLSSRQVDLSTLPRWSTVVRTDHSGQFISFCADDWAFWEAVLKSMLLK